MSPISFLTRPALFFLGLWLTTPALGAGDMIVLASTTSVDQSGLFKQLLPAFTAQTGIKVRVLAVGSGQALALARRGDADVVLVHDRAMEDQFLAEGYSTRRWPLMTNDYVIVGPGHDPAGIRGLHQASRALERITRSTGVFVSRGDNSGTHALEQRLWAAAGLSTAYLGTRYRAIGAGMGQTLNTASALQAYLLTDRASWLSFANRGSLEVLVDGDAQLLNQYNIMAVSPLKHPHVKYESAEKFIAWLVSPEGQRHIAAYRLQGKQVFFPNTAP